MLNFKQYLLKESKDQFAYLDFFVSYADEPDDYYSVQDKIIRTINNLKIPGLEIVNYGPDFLNIEIRFDLSWLKTNQKLLHQYQIKILDTVFPILKPVKLDIENTKSDIAIRTIPDFVIEWDAISIYAQTNGSLKNIHKFIKCDELTINDSNNIKSNVLGLLKLDCEISFFGADNIKWTEIIKKHLIDKNLVACQEDFFKNDLDEYAKL